jgi:small subunit ribosomal protein S17
MADTETTASSTAATAPDAAGSAPAPRHARKVREGLVVSDKMDKTAVVAVIERVRHAKYDKFVLRTKKLYAHDENNDANLGDRVRVMETRPLSKSKNWRVIEILERAK